MSGGHTASRTGPHLGALGRVWLVVVLVFLYAPIVALVLQSFNNSPIPNVWRGFSLEAYRSLLDDRELLSGLWLSLKIASASATASVLLGTLAALALATPHPAPARAARWRLWHGMQGLLGGLVRAPMVVPQVIVGLSLLLMLVSVQRLIGVPPRGVFTIWVGHTLLGLAYATVVVQARLRELDPQLREAAMDLGAPPFAVFRQITLPLIAPSLLAAWMLTFTLSLDDVVLASFLSGPGATTLPQVILARARLGLDPVVNAAGALVVALVALNVVVALGLMARRQRQQARTDVIA